MTLLSVLFFNIPMARTKEECFCEAKKYQTLAELQKNASGVYKCALKNKWLDDYVWLKRKCAWNKETCEKEARKYTSRTEFSKCCVGAYSSALKHGWLDDYTWFEVLHSNKWNKETCEKEAKKYTSRAEFQNNSPGAYDASRKHQWLDDYTWFNVLCEHGKWNRETCEKEARKYSTRAEFSEKSASAYNVARLHHWLDDYTWFTPKRKDSSGMTNLLTSQDLENMSSHQLIELISLGRLPKSIIRLAYTPSHSKDRMCKLTDLMKELAVGDKPISTSLPTPKVKGIFISRPYDDLANVSQMESFDFIVKEEMHRLWGMALRSQDNNSLLEDMEDFKSQTYSSDFANAIKDRFLRELQMVMDIPTPCNYKFPQPPSLMQKLVAFQMSSTDRFGNWCGTGSGKTNAFILATMHLRSEVVIVITPNDVLDTMASSIHRTFPLSNLITPSKPDMRITIKEGTTNYILYNYEKFQPNNGASGYLEEILRLPKVDFICLDEVQYVKVRNTKNASSRSETIKHLLQTLNGKNQHLKTMFMSATPCINNLTEVRSIIELLTLEKHEDISGISMANVHNAYKALITHGLRYLPSLPMKITERILDVDCTSDVTLLENLCANRDNVSKVELYLAQKKISAVRQEIRKGVLIYATWVAGMARLILREVRKMGFSADCYNGLSGDKDGRKDILHKFINGDLDVLICSKPITTGIDGLQKVCNKMIVISLPWTDADYTQLKGRIHRQGSVFDEVEVLLPMVTVRGDGEVWSYDKMRKKALDTKRSLSSAVVDGYVQESYGFDRDRLLSMAMDSLKAIHATSSKRDKLPDATMPKTSHRTYNEHLVNAIHRQASSTTSLEMHRRFTKDIFQEYHEHREAMVANWLEDPVSIVADIISHWPLYFDNVIDLGCGLNKLKTHLPQRKVLGVDHVNLYNEPQVIATDMVNISTIVDHSFDVAVFCLSLWGTNYTDYLQEAHKILRPDGRMIVVEPFKAFNKDRFGEIEDFMDKVEKIGFERLGKPMHLNNFLYLKFVKI